MRLVKRSVNQDDVRAYHLFYADAKGGPGTDLTFFDWPAPREQRGTRRYWFRSLYLREPNGVLFEIATEGPGFAVDEDPATLGEKMALPPFLEGQRAARRDHDPRTRRIRGGHTRPIGGVQRERRRDFSRRRR